MIVGFTNINNILWSLTLVRLLNSLPITGNLLNTGTPGVIAGRGFERVLRAPADGAVSWRYEIGITVEADQLLGTVDGLPVFAPFAGVIRGLIAPGTEVKSGMKIGDVDARADKSSCFTISDKALAIGGGVLEALLSHLVRHSSS